MDALCSVIKIWQSAMDLTSQTRQGKYSSFLTKHPLVAHTLSQETRSLALHPFLPSARSPSSQAGGCAKERIQVPTSLLYGLLGGRGMLDLWVL